jgi:hypothetical protein
MEVIYPCCGGIDVHDEFVVVCLSRVRAVTTAQGTASLFDLQRGSASVVCLVSRSRMYACSDGKYGHLLASGLCSAGGPV